MSHRLHACHAKGCTKNVPPRMFMCFHHWRMVPKTMQNAVWTNYVPGQEQRKDPTDEYLRVTREAIEFVAASEVKGE